MTETSEESSDGSAQSLPAQDLRYNETAVSAVTEMECMLIAACGQEHDPETKAIPKEQMDMNEVMTRLETMKLSNEGSRAAGAYTGEFQLAQHLLTEDKLKTLKYEFEETDNRQRPRQFYVDKIVELFQTCKDPGALIWYTGYGERHTGNWCFKDGTISLSLIINLYQTFFQGKVVYLICDCAHAGQWVVNFAKFLEDNSIAPCGHKAKDSGYLLKIFTSCRPEQRVKDFCFSTEMSLSSDKCLGFPTSQELSPTQTAFGTDFTKLLCFKHIDEECQVGELTHQWTWLDYATKQRSATLFVYSVKGKDKGKNAWYYVLVDNGKKEQFKIALENDIINLEKFGIIVSSGWGEKPPDNIEKKMILFTSD